jgi:SAM-dependent methyltransferase
VPESDYDRFAEIYSVWTDTAPSAQANLPFYVETYLATEGPVVELGVGDGRLAVAAAARGRSVTGVDASAVMLDRCRDRASRVGALEKVTLLQADFRDFKLEEPAALIALPYHSIGHLTGLETKRAALRHIHSQLRPGGRFIFDDFVVTPASLTEMRQVQLRAQYRSPAGADMLLWVTSQIDEAAQAIKVLTWEDELDPHGVLARRTYRRLTLSWLQPRQAKELIEEAGFSVEACYGDFQRTPFVEGKAREQIWVTRRP